MNVDSCIFFQLSNVSRLATRFLSQRVSGLNITPVQALILGFLNDEDQITSGELGKKTDLDSATLTGILDRLEGAGLIERKGNPKDRRAIQIHLTEKGRETGGDVVRTIKAANVDFLKGLSESEKQELMRLIGKIRS
jgi:DNA-binding MarR family transcriptional regulator